MYKSFKIENLKEVRVVVFESKDGTFWMSTSQNTTGDNIVNLGGQNRHDDNFGPIQEPACELIVQFLEQITGFKFKKKPRTEYQIEWARTVESVR